MMNRSPPPLDQERQHNAEDHTARTTRENSIRRNPHPDFKLAEASRPDWRPGDPSWTYTKTVNPTWQFGQGSNDGGECLKKAHVEINPYEEGRPAVYNYKLMISGIVPRPIGFLSTVGKDGRSMNLAPFSFTNMINYDPPLFTVGFTGCGLQNAKDTLGNLIDTRECVLNIISEHFVEAANACSINAPYGVSEWDISGLHPAESRFVKPPRVKEAIYATECRLSELREFESRDPATPGKKTGVLAILEGVNFWVREDALNEERNIIDPAVLRPISRLGGITYACTTQAFELLRPKFEDAVEAGVVPEPEA
ncbi:Flavoprotein oxygenase protein [Pleurostoma richardsiae]|uniref:Flavoprotein oxygenase protein n=1 Tax=Pleurostoma richardsiae TaxID=41990 RepID=A0AA38RI64_9PEZI|nr:Flavoprotein oxygenase protein [Pleurostoma richardsiae]